MAVIVLLLLFSFIDASSTSLSIYFFVFALVYLIFSQLINIVIRIGYSSMKQSSRLFISFVLAFIPTGILALSTLSDVTILDFVFVLAIPILVVWYGIRNNLLK